MTKKSQARTHCLMLQLPQLWNGLGNDLARESNLTSTPVFQPWPDSFELGTFTGNDSDEEASQESVFAGHLYTRRNLKRRRVGTPHHRKLVERVGISEVESDLVRRLKGG